MHLNQLYSDTMIRHLVKSGVRTFCIAPGYRSTPLVLSAESHPLAKVHIHYDERGVGFFALGIAKAKRQPVAIIVTSGTALGNLYPAVMEAKMSQISLIVISADRPFDQHLTYANQTVDQQRFFGEFAKNYFLLPPPEDSSLSFVKATVSIAVDQAKSLKAPIHINAMFKEPLDVHVSVEDQIDLPLKFLRPSIAFSPDDLLPISDLITRSKQGLILVGSDISEEDEDAIIKLSNRLGFPIVSELFGTLRSKPQVPNLIRYASLIVRENRKDLTPDLVLFFGNRLISKEIIQWLSKAQPLQWIQISLESEHTDPSFMTSMKILSTPKTFITPFLESYSQKAYSTLLKPMKEASSTLKLCIQQWTDRTTFSDLSLPIHLSKQFSQSLFIGNSLPIYSFNHLFYPENQTGPIFSNRGCSGIVGNIATVAGIQEGLQQPLVAVLGDQTFLHDINSLPLIKHRPILLIILNNQGGRIFDHLSVNKDHLNCEKYFVNPQQFHLDYSGALFDIPYTILDTFESLSFDKFTTPLIVEVPIDPKVSSKLYDDFFNEVTKPKKSPLPAFNLW